MKSKIYSVRQILSNSHSVLSLILPGEATEFAHNGRLGRVLLGQGDHDAFYIGPLAGDQLFIRFAGWPNQHVLWVLAYRLKANQAGRLLA